MGCTGADSLCSALETSPLRLTLEDRTVVPLTEEEEEFPPTLPEPPVERTVLPEERLVEPLTTLRSSCCAVLLRVEELLLRAELLLRTELLLFCEEETLLPAERVELLPEVERALLPLELERVELPEERVELPERLAERLSCCTALPRLAELLLRTELPLWEEETLLPEERVVLLPEVERALLPLELERVEEEERVVELPPEERDWPSISGAMSMATASIMEVAKMENLLIASSFLGLTV